MRRFERQRDSSWRALPNEHCSAGAIEDCFVSVALYTFARSSAQGVRQTTDQACRQYLLARHSPGRNNGNDRDAGQVVLTSPAFAGSVTLLLVLGCSDRRVSPGPTTHEVEIVAYDYAFAGASGLSAGQTTFRFTNKGKVIHELDVALLKDGTTAQAVVSALNARKPLKPLIETQVGILIARPGQRSSVGLSTDLVAGRNYLVICRFQNSASAPMHARMGMVSVIHVAPATVTAVSTAHVDTIIGFDYAFKAPATFAPGKHTLTFVNAGKVLHEVNIALLRHGVTAEQARRALKAEGDFDGIEEWMGVLFAAGGASTMGRLDVTLLPEREYVISCSMTDDNHAPPHLTLGMFGSIRTTK